MRGVGACGGLPRAGLLVEGSEGVRIHGQGERLALAGLQFAGLGEGAELAGGLHEAAVRSGDVQLHDFLAGEGTGVGHGDGGGDSAVLGHFHGRLGIGEGRVGEAVAERIGHILADGGEVAVTHPDAFLVFGEVHVGLFHAAHAKHGQELVRGLVLFVRSERIHGTVAHIVEREVVGGRDVEVGDREGHREFSGGIGRAAEDVGHRVSAFLAGGPGKQHGIRKVLPGSGFDDAADVQHHDDRLAGIVVGVAEVLQELALGARQRPVPVLGPAVAAFTRVAGNREDGDVGLGDRLVDEAAGHVHLGDDGLAEQDRRGRRVVLEFRLLQGDVLLVPVLDSLVDLEPVDAEAFGHVADIFLVHVAGAGAAGDEVIGAHAVQRDLLHALERQDAIVLQEDQAFGGRLADEYRVAFQVRIVGVLVALETRGLDNVVEHVADAQVHILDLQGAVLDAGDDFADEDVHARLQEVVDGADLLDGLAGAGPVGHHDALEAPLLAENGIQQVAVRLRVGTVDPIVGGHDGPGIGLLDGDLEALEVELAEGAWIDAGVIGHAVRLLAVAGEMLDGNAHAVGLDAAGVGGGHLAGQKGILGEILEITAAEGVPVQVHARGQEDVRPVFLHFLAHRGGEFLHQRRVPGRCQGGAHREARAVERLVRAGTGGVDAEAGRTVGEDGLRDAQARDGPGGAGGAGDQDLVGAREAADHAAPAGADQQGGLLLQGHRLQDFVDVVLVQFRLRRGRKGGEGGGQQKGDSLHRVRIMVFLS